MAWCTSTVFQGVWAGDDATYAYIGVPVAFPAFSASSGWGAVFVNSAPSGLSACDVTSTHVVVTKSEWDVLRELQVIKTTLESEGALTREFFNLEGQATRQTIIGMSNNVTGSVAAQGTALSARTEDMEGSFVVVGLGFMLVLGLFFGWKALGRGAGRSG